MTRGPGIARWHSYLSFIEAEAIRHPQVVCPVMLMWKAYKAFCQEWGFEQCEASEFMGYLRSEEGTEIREGGRGRLRRVVVGIGLQPKEKETDVRRHA